MLLPRSLRNQSNEKILRRKTFYRHNQVKLYYSFNLKSTCTTDLKVSGVTLGAKQSKKCIKCDLRHDHCLKLIPVGSRCMDKEHLFWGRHSQNTRRKSREKTLPTTWYWNGRAINSVFLGTEVRIDKWGRLYSRSGGWPGVG